MNSASSFAPAVPAGFRLVPLATLPATARHAFREARPPVQAVFALRFVVGVLLAGGRPWEPRCLLAGLAWTALTGAVYLLNGWSDAEGDRLNASVRPIATGQLPARRALALVTGLTAAGLLGLACTAPAALPCALLMALLGAWYSCGPRPLKSSALGAPLSIGGGALLTWVAGLRCAGGAVDGRMLALVCLFSLWIAVTSSTKDFSDAVGDRAAGRRTWPVLLGARRAAGLVGAAGLLVALVLLVAVAGQDRDVLTLAALVPLAGSVAVAGLLGVMTRETPAGAVPAPNGGGRALRRAYRAFMTTQYTMAAVLAVGVLAERA
ncbi:UbiA family prenyltransferase [Streptomyces sp. NPDC050392]|uniref:UbiA family prenyltransferase n=1 Tax=Streptomyces sp. NPDC050392 TaxID=3155782 RepID=UPI00344228AF